MKKLFASIAVLASACGIGNPLLFGPEGRNAGGSASSTGGPSAAASGGMGGLSPSISGGTGASSSSQQTSTSSSFQQSSSSAATSSSQASSSSSSGGGMGWPYPVGVQQDVPPSVVSAAGWSICYQDVYADSIQKALPQIKAACSGQNLMLACKHSAAQNYQVLAAAPRVDVFTDTGPVNGQTHLANGVQWYYNNDWAWGFAPAGVPVWQMQCDINQGADRMCWLIINQSGGWRCGDSLGLNNATDWQRFIFQK